MRHDPVAGWEESVQFFVEEAAEVAVDQQLGQDGGAALHQSLDEQRTVDLLLEQGGAPEVLLHLARADEYDASDAERGELRPADLFRQSNRGVHCAQWTAEGSFRPSRVTFYR